MTLDGDPGTFACLLDDTRTGNDPHSRPPNGSLPVTGIVVFDLGALHKVCGWELVSRLAEIEIDNLRKLLAARTQGKTFAPEDFQVFDQGGPEARRRFEQTCREQ
jgi:hypothetical protein